MRKFKIYLIIILISGVLLFTVNFITNYFGERVGVYITNKASVYSVVVIEEAIRDEVVSRIDIDELVIFQKDQKNTITNVSINTKQINNILANVNKSVVKSMEALEEEKLSLPLGIIV